MKLSFIISGFAAAAAGILVSLSPTDQGSARLFNTLSRGYKWTQVAPPGSGTHQHQWKAGTYPSAIVPLKAFKGDLWMVGQKKAWSSHDGIHWHASEKYDWGERISMALAFFDNTFWISGGMDYETGEFLNEIWASKDGKHWTRVVKNATWSPRKGHTLVAFKNRLWLFGGETSVDKHRSPDAFINDIWSSADGISWTIVAENAPWEVRGRPRVIVFKGELWLIGGQGRSDIWRSGEGVSWTKLKTESAWKDRYDFGLQAFDDRLWLFGGRAENPRNAYNDVWSSADGIEWELQMAEAPWTRRSGGFSVVFRNKLLLFGGKHTGHEDGFSGDIWTMEKL